RPHDHLYWAVGVLAHGGICIAGDASRSNTIFLRHGQTITASGSTPYVVNGLAMAQKNGVATGCITCNTDTSVSQNADCPIEVIVGPEFITGSTRMKAGTAQKMVLNMISTSVMIRLGRVIDNKMVDMQLNNAKLVQRGALMLVQALAITEGEAHNLLANFGSVRRVLDYYRNGASGS
ncbi:MAG: N-acetylmuramic acid 6-phosphate etherase, partial [Bacteroidota bacterium]